MKKRLQVLLSTYNGERFLREQLDSILAQTYAPDSILVRDDGSTDGTRAILEEYRQRCPEIRVIYGDNRGSVSSFFALFLLADPSMDYYALADQDDVWMPDKLEAAVRELARLSEGQEPCPLLYCGAQRLVDETLTPFGGQPTFPVREACFGNALVQNICTGCTAVYNQELARLLRQDEPEAVIMHDWWLYLVASCFGRVIYDPRAHIDYRQHGSNAFGAKTSSFGVWKYRLGALFRPRIPIREQLLSFSNHFAVGGENRALLELVLEAHKSLGKKRRLAREQRVFRQKTSDDRLYRGLIWLGRI